MSGRTYTPLAPTPPGEAAVRCEWFGWCDRRATHHVSHPALGTVPACDRCVARVRRADADWAGGDDR